MDSYAYTSYLWPALVLAVFLVFLAWYGWRHRKTPGATAFAAGCLFGLLWSLGSMLDTAAVDAGAKIFWFRFLTIWQMPVVTAGTCFVVQFAGLGRWLTKRVVALLAAPPIIFAIVVLTDGVHHFAWTSLPLVDGRLEPVRASAIAAALAYSYLLFVFNICVLVWLLVRFPRYRWPAGVMLAGQAGARAVFELGTRLGFPSQWALDPFVLAVVFSLYAVALFKYHVFDPVPAARATALAQMHEGMLVLDLEGRIVESNEAAEKTLGGSAAKLRGRRAEELLPGLAMVPWDVNDVGEDPLAITEFQLLDGVLTKHYVLETTTLTDKRGGELGRLVLLHDVTEQKRAQARLVEQERIVATLEERERLARELHDSVGQVLGYISMQAQTVRRRLQDGDRQKADSLLDRLTQIAQSAHADVRESILALRVASSDDWSFLSALRRYLEDFQGQCGIQTELQIRGGANDGIFVHSSAVQLLKIVQEALSNTRKHGCAENVWVTVECDDEHVRIVVADDGRGFDPTHPADDRGHFGLVFMRERMEQIGGRLEIDSRTGAGARVILTVPLSGDREAIA